MLANDVDESGCLSFEEFLQAMPRQSDHVTDEEHRYILNIVIAVLSCPIYHMICHQVHNADRHANIGCQYWLHNLARTQKVIWHYYM